MTGRYKAYPEYKNTAIDWLGNVPSHWIVARLKNTLRIKNGRDYKDVEVLTDGYPVYGSGGIFKRSSAYLYDGESVLFGRKGTVDKPLLVDGKFWTVDTMFYSEIAPKMDARFIHNQAMLFPYNLLSTNTALPSMTQEDLLELGFVYPSFEEQQQIANFLDHETAKIDTLITKQEKLIELLKEKRQAVISHAVTKGLNPDAPMKDSGVEWLGEVPEHWEVCRLKHIKGKEKGSFVDGPFGSNLKSEHFIDNGDVYVIESNFATTGSLILSKLKTISTEHFETISRSETGEGAIILAKIGARYGMSSILPALPKKAVVSGNSLSLKVNQDQMNTQYCHKLLTHLKIEGAMDDGVNVTAQPALSLGQLNNLPFLCPPLDEQMQLIEYLDSTEKSFSSLIEQANQMILLSQERKTALISAAVTGKIDVRDWQPQGVQE